MNAAHLEAEINRIGQENERLRHELVNSEQVAILFQGRCDQVTYQRNSIKAMMREAKTMIERGEPRDSIAAYMAPVCDDPEARGERPLLEDAG